MSGIEDQDEVRLADSLGLLGGPDSAGDVMAVTDMGTVMYGQLELVIAPKSGKVNTLLADHLFSPALLLAERIERGVLPLKGRTVVELGAGCALPSLLASTLKDNAPRLAVVTDYPSEDILGSLRRGVALNSHLVQTGCRVACVGYEWGRSVSRLLGEAGAGFDVVIMSDLLHFDRSHGELAESVVSLLARHDQARVYVAAGKYTAWHVCENFLQEMRRRGLECSDECSAEDGCRDEWLGSGVVGGLSRLALGRRKGHCWWWVARWPASQRLLALRGSVIPAVP